MLEVGKPRNITKNYLTQDQLDQIVNGRPYITAQTHMQFKYESHRQDKWFVKVILIKKILYKS